MCTYRTSVRINTKAPVNCVPLRWFGLNVAQQGLHFWVYLHGGRNEPKGARHVLSLVWHAACRRRPLLPRMRRTRSTRPDRGHAATPACRTRSPTIRARAAVRAAQAFQEAPHRSRRGACHGGGHRRWRAVLLHPDCDHAHRRENLPGQRHARACFDQIRH